MSFKSKAIAFTGATALPLLVTFTANATGNGAPVQQNKQQVIINNQKTYKDERTYITKKDERTYVHDDKRTFINKSTTDKSTKLISENENEVVVKPVITVDPKIDATGGKLDVGDVGSTSGASAKVDPITVEGAKVAPITVGGATIKNNSSFLSDGRGGSAAPTSIINAPDINCQYTINLGGGVSAYGGTNAAGNIGFSFPAEDCNKRKENRATNETIYVTGKSNAERAAALIGLSENNPGLEKGIKTSGDTITDPKTGCTLESNPILIANRKCAAPAPGR